MSPEEKALLLATAAMAVVAGVYISAYVVSRGRR